MKNVLVATALVTLGFTGIASAADLQARMPVKAPPPVALIYSWTGFYLGAHAGYGWGSNKTTVVEAATPLVFPIGTQSTFKSDGFLGGVQAGYNYQISNWVIGVEGDFSWTDAKGSVTSTSLLIPSITTTAGGNYSWFATLTGRVGYAHNNWLFFAKGGAAFARVELTTSSVTGVGTFTGVPIKDTLAGYTVGAGVEYGFLTNWSVKAEYDYMDFGTTRRAFVVNGTLGPAADYDTHVHVVKVGLNYRFGG